MAKTTLLLSIRPIYARMILEGTKTVELRRVLPRIEAGDTTLLYVASPVKALTGAFRVTRVISTYPSELWEMVGMYAGVSRKEFNAYFEATSMATAIFFHDVCMFPFPIALDRLRLALPSFEPPQSFRYLNQPQVDVLLDLAWRNSDVLT